MRKRVKRKSLSRSVSQKKALMRTLMVSLINEEIIQVTLDKAKEFRPWAEKLVTRAKKGISSDSGRMNALRLLNRDLPAKSSVDLMEVARRFKKRPGGYLRIVKINRRKSDKAKMALVSWTERAKVDGERNKTEKKLVKKEKKEGINSKKK